MQFRHLPIQRRLVAIIFLTTLAVLLGSYVVLLVYETRRTRQTTVQGLETMADIIASNSTAALIYDDPNLAGENLAGLRAEPDVTEAALFDKDGKLFAAYPAKLAPPALPSASALDGVSFSMREMVLYKPVVQAGARVGTLFIKSDLGEMYRRLRVYGWVLAGVLAGGGVCAYYLSKLFQRQISEPILNLAETARVVSEQRDYSVRAEKRSGDEIGFVTDAFNAMLEQIQSSHAALREREVQMRLMTDNAAVYLCQIGSDHRFKFMNRAYARRYGVEADAIVGMHMSELLGKDAYELVRGEIDLALAGHRQEFEIEIPYEKFGKRWIHAVYEPVKGEDGKPAIVAVSTDTTERQQAANEVKRARDEAVNASRAKDDFLAALSHELRTPLNPILLLATDAVNNPSLPETVRSDFDTVRKNVELEARLIDDLLDLTRITSGKLILKHGTVNVHSVVRDALSTVQAELSAKRIELVMELWADQPFVRGDAVRLQQVFWNVLKNAVKFTSERGKITILTGLSEDKASLVARVTDTGIGISREELDHVFEAFSQGDHSKGAGYHRFGGLGLGLAISRKMIELHSGRIYAESEGRDQGSSFTIQLPLAPAEEQKTEKDPEFDAGPEESAAPPPETPESRGSVLLVEDHAPTRRVLKYLLQRRNYRVVAEGSVEEARRSAENERIDFVISDIGLPDGNGYELMAELRRRFNLHGIALTGYGMEDDIARSREAGFVAHLTKPVGMQALDAAIAATLREARAHNGDGKGGAGAG